MKEARAVNVRPTLILVAVFLLGVSTAGAFLGRSAVAEQPRPPEPSAGRYQIVPLPASGPNGVGSVVVMDVATGECWSNDVNGRQDTWARLGVPSKTK
jgi:hypothetical protein